MRNIDPDSEENQKASRENEAYAKALRHEARLQSMRTSYFTFGQVHVHSVNGRTFDKDTVVKITAENPRDVMFEHFGAKWSMEYDQPPDMSLFAEIVEL